jgi:hypothetical protein
MLPGVGKSFQLTPVAQEIVEALKDVLGGMLMLIDDHEKVVHTAMSRGWFSFRGARLSAKRHRCHAEVTVNDRWTLFVLARKHRPLRPDTAPLVTWAAQKLAHHLPRRPADDLPYPPTGGSGGPPSSAEVGIPVWWARRARN